MQNRTDPERKNKAGGADVVVRAIAISFVVIAYMMIFLITVFDI
jgi:hypothetical protein